MTNGGIQNLLNLRPKRDGLAGLGRLEPFMDSVYESPFLDCGYRRLQLAVKICIYPLNMNTHCRSCTLSLWRHTNYTYIIHSHTRHRLESLPGSDETLIRSGPRVFYPHTQYTLNATKYNSHGTVLTNLHKMSRLLHSFVDLQQKEIKLKTSAAL